MHAVRVYGSDSQYGREPRQNPRGEPITLENFPLQEEVVEILLGQLPVNYFEAHRRKTALSNIVLDSFLGRGIEFSEQGTMDNEIRSQLENVIAVPVPKTYAWYVTISVRRAIEIQDDLIIETDFPLVELPAEKLREFHKYAAPYLDHLAAVASTVIGTEFFENVMFDEVLLSGPKGIVTRIPERHDFKMSGRASIGKPMEALDLAALLSLLSSGRLELYAKNRWLESAVHWYTAMLNEADRWKAFQYAFLSLEILTNKVSGKLLTGVTNSFAFRKSDGELLSEIPMAELLGSQERRSLLSRFCVVALGLSPGTVQSDVRAFKNAKEARNRFSHGDIRYENELPLHSLKELCSRYLEAVFRATSLW